MRRLVVAALAVAGFGAERVARAQLLSPGDLSQPHAPLEGDSHCADCHSSGKRVDDGKCQGCHTDLRARIQAGAGLHGRSFRGQPCTKCHVEHLGRKARLVRWPGGDMTRLDHAQTGWELRGAHRPIACLKCHDKRNARGAATFLGVSSACASCHQDPHAGRFGADCAGCHEERSWKEVKIGAFDHGRTRFPLKGKHVKVACEKCHGAPAKWAGLKFASCGDCHQDPHRGKFKPSCVSCHVEDAWSVLPDRFRRTHPGVSLAGGHAQVACKRCHDRGDEKPPSKGSKCVDCHRPVHEAPLGRDCKACHAAIRWVGLPREIGLEAHAKTPYPLKGKHVAVDCARCHPADKPAAARYRALVFDRCTGCHADRHGGEFAGRDGGDCGPCHRETGFAPAWFGVKLHASTRFPLEGRHEAAPCSGCHPAKRPRLDFRVAKRECADCHPNPHGDQFRAEMAQGGCAHCHTLVGWGNPKVDHSIWPLTGAHLSAPCSGCHEKERYRGAPRECEGCHLDVHAGQFRLTEPKKACDACHDTRGYAIPAFDHAGQSGWALEGKHARLACALCHRRERLRNGQQAVRWRLGYRACRDCHADPHGEPR